MAETGPALEGSSFQKENSHVSIETRNQEPDGKLFPRRKPQGQVSVCHSRKSNASTGSLARLHLLHLGSEAPEPRQEPQRASVCWHLSVAAERPSSTLTKWDSGDYSPLSSRSMSHGIHN